MSGTHPTHHVFVRSELDGPEAESMLAPVAQMVLEPVGDKRRVEGRLVLQSPPYVGIRPDPYEVLTIALVPAAKVKSRGRRVLRK
jgi:hypothetical protein